MTFFSTIEALAAGNRPVGARDSIDVVSIGGLPSSASPSRFR